MAGQPKRRAMIEQLEKRTRDYFEDDPTPSHLDYIACWIENGQTIVSLAADLSTDLGFHVGREFISTHLRRTFGEEAVDARLSNARAYASHCMAEQALTIADGTFETQVDVSSAALSLKARQWTAERWNRKEYGQSKDVNVAVSITSLHLSALQSVTNIVTDGVQQPSIGSGEVRALPSQVVEAQQVSDK